MGLATIQILNSPRLRFILRHRKPLNAQINADPNANTKAGGTSARRMAD
jgi:hypothetical protein